MVKLSGTITDSAHYSVANAWVQDGNDEGGVYGERARTDSTGGFHLLLDNIHGVIFFYGERLGKYGYNPGIGAYNKNRLHVNNKCVATPIAIVVPVQD